ncbi:MAG: DUF4380 domain-containing protein [Paludibacteraceae bacterium]|nr:DUF4380 domain-containing protein [Paludibacteraceae bacterium]
MIELSYKKIKLTILPDVGGRIVSLQYDGSENLLESDANQWDEKERPQASPFNLDFKAYNGHEVWIGPQSQWWKHQDLNLEKKVSDLFWPPDPYISYGNFTVERPQENQLILTGPESPISGIRFTKTITITEQEEVLIEAKATNIRKEPVAWDLWMVTRVNGHNLNFVPAEANKVEVSEPTHPYQGYATYKIENGYFSFTPLLKDKEHEECTAKAFITPSRPFMASLSGKHLLTIRFAHHDPASIHPEQREVEVYSFATDKKETSLLEMEYHAPYETIPPGGSIQTSETWNIHRFEREVTKKEVIDYLEKEEK